MFAPKSRAFEIVGKVAKFYSECMFSVQWLSSLRRVEAQNKIIFDYNALVQRGVAPTELYPYYFSLTKMSPRWGAGLCILAIFSVVSPVRGDYLFNRQHRTKPEARQHLVSVALVIIKKPNKIL